MDIPHKNLKYRQVEHTVIVKNDKQKALQINFSARAFDLQGFNSGNINAVIRVIFPNSVDFSYIENNAS